MFPSIHILGSNVFWYDILKNLGTAAGALIFIILLYKNAERCKKIYLAYAVSFAFSYPFAFILRHIMESENITSFFTDTGVHFMGMVFAFYFIFPVIYSIILKTKPSEKMKGFSAVFFSVQHFFSKLGCFFLGCCFGKPYNGIFSITFPYGTNPYTVYGREIAVFPTQLFEAVSMLIVFCLIVICIKYNKDFVYFIFIIIFSVVIFISEAFMYKYDFEKTILGITMPQLCSVILILCELKRMFVKKYKGRGLLICIFIPILLSGCNQNNEASITIAVMGCEETFEAGYLNGINIALEDCRSEYPDFDINMKFFEDNENYELGAIIADKISDDENITAVIGSQSPAICENAAYSFERAGKIMAAPFSVHDYLTENNNFKHFFSICYSSEDVGRLLAAAAERTVNDKNIVVCYCEDKSGKDEAASFSKSFNGNIVDYVKIPDLNNRFEEIYSRWELLDVEAVMILPYDEEGFAIYERIKERNPNITIIGDFMFDDEEKIENSAVDFENFIMVDSFFCDNNFGSLGERYKKIFGEDMNKWAYIGYKAFRMLADTAVQNENISEVLHNSGYRDYRFHQNGRLITEKTAYNIYNKGQFNMYIIEDGEG